MVPLGNIRLQVSYFLLHRWTSNESKDISRKSKKALKAMTKLLGVYTLEHPKNFSMKTTFFQLPLLQGIASVPFGYSYKAALAIQ